MSADADKRRSATQIAALLLAMAPLVTGIYQEAQENRSRRADARATREEAAQQQRTADELADKNAAKQLAEALLGIDREGSKGERSFCNHIYLAIAQLDGEIRSPRTTTLINASLLMRNAANTRLRVCDCTIAGGVGPLWFSGFSAAGEADVAGKPSRRLVQALSSAKQECMSTECETVEAAAEEACAGDSTPSPACLGARAQQRKLCPQREADTARRVETLEALLADAQAKLAQNQQCPSSTDDLTITGDPVSSAIYGVSQGGLTNVWFHEDSPLASGPSLDKSCVPFVNCPGDHRLVGGASGGVKGLQGKTPVEQPLTNPDIESLGDGCKIAQPLGKHRRRVFIQVPDAISRSIAETFRTAINAAAPFKSPGIEVVGLSRSPERLQIRYAYGQDRDSAERLKKALDSGLCGYPKSGASAQLYPMPHLQGRTDPGVLEVWWPRN